MHPGHCHVDLGCGHLSAWPGADPVSGVSAFCPPTPPVHLPGARGRGRWTRRRPGPGAAPAAMASACPSSFSCGVLPSPLGCQGLCTGAGGPRTAARCPRRAVFKVCPGQHFTLKLPAGPWAWPWGQGCPVPAVQPDAQGWGSRPLVQSWAARSPQGREAAGNGGRGGCSFHGWAGPVLTNGTAQRPRGCPR